ncbi:type II secretion system minor pseudopilin GspK [Brevundimonas bullata]|uniref:type II secretion system minor pseudopilin GspK n=1 Tax=Brevundimonas bullata TaxID=13160 RepID=UPI001FE71C07|nr:type II secretion system minor pseudopilin GspK [Brevundimonas bullata]WQE37409.1 type II secretion system minor pseudopilin GspK [Brevundimonas bullata]
MKSRTDSREGMALLTVLLLAAVLSVIAVLVLDDVRFSIRRATNAEISSQAQWHAAGAERLALSQIRRLVQANPGRTPIDPAWDGRPFVFPVEQGEITLTVSDGQSCFNLNSVVQGQDGAYSGRDEGVRQFLRLQTLLGVPVGRARRIASATADWIDADQTVRPDGAEDRGYDRLDQPLRTGGRLLVDVSELRQVAGMDAATYARLRPYVCALPTSQLSPLNINTLDADDAPLLAMLTDGALSVSGARRVIASRPAGGWVSTFDLWRHPAFLSVSVPAAVYEQVSLETRYFDYVIEVQFAEGSASRSGLIQVGRDGRASITGVRWSRPD